MNISLKMLLVCLLLPTISNGQKLQEKPVWQFDLQFDFAKSDLKAEYFPRLDSLAVAMQDSTFIVFLKAHTDAVGNEKANFELSQKRAQSVKNYLIAKNASEKSIITEGYGENQPLVENETDEGRRLNRRVSVSVMRRLAQISGVVTDSAGQNPITNIKVILITKYVKDSMMTDSNGAYSFSTRLNSLSKIRVIPKSNDDFSPYNGDFTINNWLSTQNIVLKNKVKSQETIIKPNSKPIVLSKRVPQKVSISGIITNESSKPVDHARIVFSNDFGKDTVFTDEKGRYSVSGMMYSEVNVSISANNHLPFYKNIIVDSATKKANFKIQTIVVGKKVALQNINFYYGTSTVMSESESSLSDLVQFMYQNPKYHIEIRGHITSNTPTVQKVDNIKYELSHQRAKSIFDYLVAHGIKANRMTYVGYLNKEMIFRHPKDEAEHKANRRVEIKITSKRKG